MQSWVVQNLGWLYGVIAVACVIFMFVIGYWHTGQIRLGPDGAEPDYSTMSWISMLFAAGENALSGLQSIMVACSLPFALIIIGMMVSWAKDLGSDPATIRRAYTRTALTRNVRRGIDEHGDDFVFGVAEVPAEEGAGANFDSDDPALTEWYTDAVEGAEDAEDAETEDTEGAAESAAASDASEQK